MSVHYKFKSSKDKHTVIFDGLHISVSDLKKEIMKQRKIGKSADLDLQITNPQTGEVYETDTALIPKNTSVEVARVPNSGNQKKSWDRQDNHSTKANNSPSHIELDKITKSSNLSTSYGTEDEKIKAMMSQSTHEYDVSKYVKSRGIVGPLPSNYTCYRCGQPGHYIKQCPTNNSDVKRSTGIPRSFMIPANADQKGALLTASGDYAVPIIDHEAYKEVKKEKPPFLANSDVLDEVVLPEIPEPIKCTLCQGLLQDAVLIPCCGNSYCDECIRSLLLESDSHQCPACKEENVSPDTLIPNRYLRISVSKFTNDTGYEKIKYVSNHSVDSNKKSHDLNDKTEPHIENSVETKVETKETKEVIPQESDVKIQLTSDASKSPVQDSKDVSMDEVILGSPKKELITKVPEYESKTVVQASNVSNDNESDPVQKDNETDEDGNESQQETATGSNTPLVDEPSEPFESNKELTAPETEVNQTIMTLGQYPNQQMAPFPRPQRMILNPCQIRPIRATMGQQSSNQMMVRPPNVGPYARTKYPQTMRPEMRYYRPMADPRYFGVNLAHVPPYGYAPQIRPPQYADPYGYMGPRPMSSNPMHHPLGMPQTINEGPPGIAPITSDSMYSYPNREYDDYEERVSRFTKQLESRSRRRPIPRSRSRSRSGSRSGSSRSRSSSGSSSSSSGSSGSSSLSFSSKSFSGSSRSYSPRRRSRSKNRGYRRRSRTPSPRRNYGRDYRYRRSRSPYNNDSRGYYRSKRGYDYERERNDKYRDSKSTKYERNESSYRSRRDEKGTDSTTRSRCTHKSSNDKSRDKESESLKTKKRSKTPVKDENAHNSDKVIKAENMSEKQTLNDSVNPENVNNTQVLPDLPKADKTETVSKESAEKKKDKHKKHHKHRHHSHHRHRKGSTDSKDESKKKQKHKKSKDSENLIKSEPEVKAEELVSLDVKVENSNLNAFPDNVSEKQIFDNKETIVDQYETVFDSNSKMIEPIDPQVINYYEVCSTNTNEIQADIASTDIPNYITTEFTEQNKATDEELINVAEIFTAKDSQIVNYTDNEDLPENETRINDNCNENVADLDVKEDTLENADKSQAVDETINDIQVEIPKSKWDEDPNDLKLEEDYSDFDESQKSESELIESKTTATVSLPKEIIERAEKAILEKPLNPNIFDKKDKSSDSRIKSTKSDDKIDDKSRKSKEIEPEKERNKNNDKSSSKSSDKKDSSDSKDHKRDDSSDNHSRKVKLDRSKFAEKPTLSITIENSNKDKNGSKVSQTSNENKESKSHSSSYKSSRDRSKDRSKSDRNSSKDTKESSKSSKSGTESRHRSHKRSKRSRSRSSSHKRYKSERKSHKKSKSSKKSK